MEPRRTRPVLAAQRLVLRASGPRARRLAELACLTVARAVGRYLTWNEQGAATYVRGGLGGNDFVPGLSDVDLAVVLAAGGAERARRRWQRLCRALPPAELLVDSPRIYHEAELRDLAGASALSYGLGGAERSAYHRGAAGRDLIRALERPGLYGATADWRLLAGPDRRPAEPGRDAQDVRLAAWLELAYWWRLVFPFCVDPSLPRSADLSVKLVAEPARIWLWLAHGERAGGRADALRRAAARLPAEEAPLRRALDLQRSLPGAPAPRFAELLPLSLRLSARIAGLIAGEIEPAGVRTVGLAGIPGREDGALPLADWRALACPGRPDESFVPVAGRPDDPAALAAAAGAADGAYPALRAGALVVMPALELPRTRLRALKSPVADPVLFAVLDGAAEARFPEVRGWSAGDTARRAVAEHRAWLRAAAPEPAARRLGLLLTAARAGLFLQSVEDGEPELCVTVAEAARRLGADAAHEAYREFTQLGSEPSPDLIAGLRRRVLGLRAYQAGDPLHH